MRNSAARERGAREVALDLERFEALTFDCYGTLIDWERGILVALRRLLDGRAAGVEDDELLEAHARHETAWEAADYLPYREVLQRTLAGIFADLGLEASGAEQRTYAAEAARWPAFPDSAAALARLAERYRLGVITNCDDDIFEASRQQLGIDFEWVVTAQQVRSYKPSRRNFEAALERLTLPPERVLHVAQSLFHDHGPARELGLATAWINRRMGRPGFGATPAADVAPDLTLPDLASLANLALVTPARATSRQAT